VFAFSSEDFIGYAAGAALEPSGQYGELGPRLQDQNGRDRA
jgi:hypothetical protein